MAVLRHLHEVLDSELGVEPCDVVTEAYAWLLTLGADATDTAGLRLPASGAEQR